MTKIISYRNYTINSKGRPENIKRGQYILYEDGWFEGVEFGSIVDPFIKDRLTFGFCFQKETMKQVTADILPAVFEGKWNKDSFEGDLNHIGSSLDPNKSGYHVATRESVIQDVRKLQSRIDRCKSSMYLGTRELYDNAFASREALKPTAAVAGELVDKAIGEYGEYVKERRQHMVNRPRHPHDYSFSTWAE